MTNRWILGLGWLQSKLQHKVSNMLDNMQQGKVATLLQWSHMTSADVDPLKRPPSLRFLATSRHNRNCSVVVTGGSEHNSSSSSNSSSSNSSSNSGKDQWVQPGPSKVFEVGVYSLENRRLPKVVVASRLCRDEGKMGVNCL